LESRQRAIYTANPGIADPFSRAELNKPNAIATLSDVAARLVSLCDAQACIGDKDLYSNLREQLRCASLPTRFESPLFYLYLQTTSKQLESLRHQEYPSSGLIRFGSLPTGTIDAQAMQPPGLNTPIVILNRDLFYFTGVFSRSIADSVPIEEVRGAFRYHYEPELIFDRLDSNPEIVEQFADAMARMIETGTPRGAIRRVLDAEHARLHARLLSSMQSFAIAHEQAHVILGHLSRGSESYSVVPASGTENRVSENAITYIRRSRQDEFDADALGYSQMLKALRREDGTINLADLAVAAAAADSVFGIIDAADKYSRQRTGKSFSDSRHPSADDRRRALDVVRKKLATRGELLYGVPDFRENFNTGLDAILLEADPIIREKLGIAPK
jgi:hypothetical protein